MNETDETLERTPDSRDILKAIENLSKRFDALETRFDNLEKDLAEKFRNSDARFEAIREGIVYNSSKFDRLEAVVYNARRDISNLRADVKDLTEEIRQIKKESVA